MNRLLKSIGIEVISTGLIGGCMFLIDGDAFDFKKFIFIMAGLSLLFNISLKFLRRYMASRTEVKMRGKQHDG